MIFYGVIYFVEYCLVSVLPYWEIGPSIRLGDVEMKKQ